MRSEGRRRRVRGLWLVLVVVGAAILARVEGARAQPAGAADARPIVVQNAYFPKPGLEEEVYRLRLEAWAVRARLGLAEGRVLRRVAGPEGGAGVIWEAEYPDVAAGEKDMAVLARSEDFSEIQRRMGTLTRRFERSVWEVAPGT
jgi:hypothetical protein